MVSEYYATRPNLHVSKAPLCVLFFACSGSGKSTIRRLLVDELQATYVCNDEVRELLKKYPQAAEQGIELKEIVARTVEKIYAEAPNKFVIFDNNIVHYYMHADSYLNVAKAHQRPTFIIGLEVSESELKERIRERDINVTSILGDLPQQLIDYKNATNDIQPDWVMRATDGAAAFKPLINALNDLTSVSR